MMHLAERARQFTPVIYLNVYIARGGGVIFQTLDLDLATRKLILVPKSISNLLIETWLHGYVNIPFSRLNYHNQCSK